MTKGIVIGGGRSLWETNILTEIIKAQFSNRLKDISIMVCDRMLDHCIKQGLMLYNVSTCTQDIMEDRQTVDLFCKFYDCLQFDRFGIDIYLSDTVDPVFLKYVSMYGNTKLFHRKYKKGVIGLGAGFPMINTCGNVGIACWNILRQLKGCDQIAILGLDFEAYQNDLTGNNWEVEREHSKKEIERYSFECSTYNLSPYSTLKSDHILDCTLDEFLTDSYSGKYVGNPNDYKYDL